MANNKIDEINRWLNNGYNYDYVRPKGINGAVYVNLCDIQDYLKTLKDTREKYVSRLEEDG